MSDIHRLEIAVDAAEIVQREAWAAYRAAHRAFFDADFELYIARTNLAEALARLPQPPDTQRKATS